MQKSCRLFSSLLLGVALAGPGVTAGCAHHYYTAYDPYYQDRHVWNDQETVYYQQWVIENHRDPHVDYRHLAKEDQKRYWDWRHQHDHDHDHDHN